MKDYLHLRLENVNLQSNAGPNSFGQKLHKYMSDLQVIFQHHETPDAYLCFIESNVASYNAPMFQRLDGIYFNIDFDYKSQNANIKRTYELANGVIFQSHFNQKLISKYFGSHENCVVIHNGADLDTISQITPLQLDDYDNVWCCASSWRPHKRLNDNIKYFLEHKNTNDVLMVAGYVKPQDQIQHPNIKYLGDVSQNFLYSIYKRSKYFLHLAWLDHCPNVVVDARACECKIICSSAGGTIEIAGNDSIIIEEEEWDFQPTQLYSPPKLDFSNKTSNTHNVCYDMSNVSNKYLEFITKGIHAANS